MMVKERRSKFTADGTPRRRAFSPSFVATIAARKAARTLDEQGRILAWLEEFDAPATYADVAAGTGLSQLVVAPHLKAMRVDGRVLFVGHRHGGTRKDGAPSLWLPGPAPEGWTE
jgi:hypothetical protein